MDALRKRQITKFLLILSSVFFSCNERALADSTATATAFLNFGSATFSGPVAPSTGIGFGGDLSGDATITQAAGFDLSSNTFLFGGVNGVVGWGPVSSTLQIGPTNFSLASAGTGMTTVSTIAGNYSVFAQVDRLGSILSTNGNINISIPYTFNISMSGCGPGTGCTAETEVYLLILNQGEESGVSASFIDQFGAVTNYSAPGVLSLQVSGLPPGTYDFDAGAFSQATYVPEPGTLLLVGAGLLGLVGTSLRRRFA